MPPTFLVEFDMGGGRWPRRVIEIARIALRAGHAGGAACAGVLAVPRRVGMVLADPAAVRALSALHRLSKRSDSWDRSPGSCQSTKSCTASPECRAAADRSVGATRSRYRRKHRATIHWVRRMGEAACFKFRRCMALLHSVRGGGSATGVLITNDSPGRRPKTPCRESFY
jgi:hypothetical protein